MAPVEPLSDKHPGDEAPAPWWHRPALRTKTLKHWKPAELLANNLDFSFATGYPQLELIRLWLWELDRELGTVKEAFVDRDRRAKPIERPFPAGQIRYDVELPPGLKCHPLKELLPRIKSDTDWIWKRGAPYSTIHAFEIEWALGLPLIEAAFHAWLLGQCVHRDRGDKARVEVYRHTKGRKDIIETWLMELAIYRIDSAGLNYKNGLKHLNDLGIRQKKNIQLDSSYWSHSKRRSKARILLYKREVEISPGYEDRITAAMPLAWNLLKSFGRPSIDKPRRPSR